MPNTSPLLSPGNTQTQYSYDSFGRATKRGGLLAPDFQYANYYLHTASALNLTRSRAYNSTLGRWINRDPVYESGGINLYDYVQNSPISFTDPRGLGCGWGTGYGWGSNPALGWGWSPSGDDESDDGSGEEPPPIYKPPLNSHPPSWSVIPHIRDPFVVISPFYDCEDGKTDPECCEENFDACRVTANKLYRARKITAKQLDEIIKCCRGALSDCRKQSQFGYINWEDCFPKSIRFKRP